MIGFSRWRRSKGFGIHSPFAFDFVGGTLREKAEYYAYAKLRDLLDEAAADGARELPDEDALTLTVRLIARFQPRRVYVGGDPSGLVVQAVRLADSRVDFTAAEPQMAIFAGRDLSADDVALARDVLSREGVVAILSRHPRAVDRALSDGMACGMTFRSRRRFVAVGFSRLPRQNFEINF